jgi:hypothetical protein
MQSWWWWIDLTRWHISFPLKENAMAQEMRRFFFMHVFKHHGFLKDIVLD